jgi:cytochrome c oxidase subunit 2
VLTKGLVVGAALLVVAGCGQSDSLKTTGGDATRGKTLYTSLTCDGCHTLTGTRGTGPTFKDLAGSKVNLKSGKTVIADESYLYESIETPNKELVSTYSALMESAIKPHAVSQRDARDLIAFIKTVR